MNNKISDKKISRICQSLIISDDIKKNLTQKFQSLYNLMRSTIDKDVIYNDT